MALALYEVCDELHCRSIRRRGMVGSMPPSTSTTSTPGCVRNAAVATLIGEGREFDRHASAVGFIFYKDAERNRPQKKRRPDMKAPTADTRSVECWDEGRKLQWHLGRGTQSPARSTQECRACIVRPRAPLSAPLPEKPEWCVACGCLRRVGAWPRVNGKGSGFVSPTGFLC